MQSLQDQVMAVLDQAAGRPIKAKDVSKALSLPADDRGSIRQALFDLVTAGRAVQLEGRRFISATADNSTLGVRGHVQRKASGIGWFIPTDKARKDAYLPPHELRGVVDGDVVMAKIERGTKGPIASIVKVLERMRDTVTGTLQVSQDRRFGHVRYIEVDDNLMSGPVRLIDGDADNNSRASGRTGRSASGRGAGRPSSRGGEGNDEVAVEGDVVEVQLIDWPTPTQPATGRVVRRLGRKGALDVEIERLVVQSGVARTFPADVVNAAEQLGDDPTEKQWKGRLDLRSLPIVTIDGETAKDFDDAVYATRRDQGPKGKRTAGDKIEVTVCVADVSYYVREGEPLDREAVNRTTSIYYPGRVIPMLPEALSNGLCSLRPRVPRLCAVVQFAVDQNGGVSEEALSFGVMQSHARLTYSMVQRFLDEDEGVETPYEVPPQPKEATQSTADIDDDVAQNLRDLAEAARRLRKARGSRGAMDFELPETVIDLDEKGEPLGLRHLNRAFSHRLIEDLMIAANEAAARSFDQRNAPSVYRIHEAPDEEKLSRFLGLARPAYMESTGDKLPEALMNNPTSTKALMALMAGIGDHPSRQALDMLLLRSMKQARYATDNAGHYGLGSEAYLHFTSPIRRYPDLVVHRLLRARLEGKAKARRKGDEDDIADDALVGELDAIAQRCSEQERKAADLERAIQALHACWLVKDRIGEEHEAIVTGVTEHGAFVRLTDLFVEGLVRMDALGPEYFSYDESRLQLLGERSREVIGIGTLMMVEIADVDFTRRQIAFVRTAPVLKASGKDQDKAKDKDKDDGRAESKAERPRQGTPSTKRQAPQVETPKKAVTAGQKVVAAKAPKAVDAKASGPSPAAKKADSKTDSKTAGKTASKTGGKVTVDLDANKGTKPAAKKPTAKKAATAKKTTPAKATNVDDSDGAKKVSKATKKAPKKATTKKAKSEARVARDERRAARVDNAVAKRDALREDGKAVKMPNPTGASRHERFERYAAYEDAKRRIAAGTATTEEIAYVEARKAHLSTRRKVKNDARAARRDTKDAKAMKRDKAQDRYDRQQQRGPDEDMPAFKRGEDREDGPTGEKPRLRGPDDLRALAESRLRGGGDRGDREERGGADGDNGRSGTRRGAAKGRSAANRSAKKKRR